MPDERDGGWSGDGFPGDVCPVADRPRNGTGVMSQLACAVVLVLSAGSSPAAAWGCDGHQAVVILAQRLLSPTAIARMRAVLGASPVDPAIKPFCRPVDGDPVADAATWADDNRAIDPTTGGWHFIDFPLAVGDRIGDYRQYCRDGNCVVAAIVAQYAMLTTTANPTARGNALRYLLHLIGDLHQPLHTTTNGDRGGNCLPVTYGDQRPSEDGFHNFRPNLHSVWDDGMIRRLMMIHRLANSRALADYAAKREALRAVAAQPAIADVVASWAIGVNASARAVTYGKLPIAVPTEPSEMFSMSSCDDNNHASRRMAALGEVVGASYERASLVIIMRQLRLAAERLAAVLKAAFPS